MFQRPLKVIFANYPKLYDSEIVFINSTSPSTICLNEKLSLQWQPGAVTVFALPVIEIEILINKLTALVSSSDAADAFKLSKQISNWNSVLASYRAHNSEVVDMFTANTMQFNDIISQFKSFQEGQTSLSDFVAALDTNAYVSESFSISTDTIYSFMYDLNRAYSDISNTCDEVLPYSLDASSNYLANVCNDFSSSTWKDFAKVVMGACSLSADGTAASLLSQSVLFQNLCQSAQVNGDSIPGGLQSTTGGTGIMGFLSDSKKLITFGANSPLTLSWTTAVTDSKTFITGYEVDALLSIEGEIDIGGGIEDFIFDLAGGAGGDQAIAISLGQDSHQGHGSELTVTVTLDDSDSGDFFAVRFTEDPMFGTPIFTTMGGASKCPGETGTSRRESNVRILEIRHRCGVDKASICNELTLNPGDFATFGAVIENLSPTQDEVYYTIQLTSLFDDYETSGGDGNYVCGTPGQLAGLMVTFQNSDLRRVPYNRLVEVIFTVTNNQNGAAYMCNTFNDVGIQIIATCEMPSPNSYVYQYGVIYNDSLKATSVLYDPGHVLYAANATATFSVTWPNARRLTQVEHCSSPVDGVNGDELRSLKESTHIAISELKLVLWGVALMTVINAVVVAKSIWKK